MLRLAEEIILLALDEKGGEIAAGMSSAQFDTVLAGAVLMDLALENRIDTDPDSLVLVDSTPTGDPLLDPTLAKIAASADRRDTAWWIEETARGGGEPIRETALARLQKLGILESDSSSEGIFVLSARVSRLRRYPAHDEEAAEEVRLRIMRTLFDNDIPGPHDIVLVCLADASGVLSLMLSKSELQEVRERIELIRSLDLIGRTVSRAVQASKARLAAPAIPRVRPWTDLPSPRKLPVIGNLADMIRDLRGFFTAQYRALGPVFRIRALGTDLIVMAGPEANRFAATGNNYFRNHDMWNSFNAYLRVNKSLINVDGPEHLQMRRDHAPVYSHKLIEHRMADALEIVRRHVADWPVGASVPGFHAWKRIFAEQIGYLATGVSARDHIDDLIRFSNTLLSTHVSRHVPKLALRLPRFRRSHQRTDEFVRKVVDSHAAGQHADRSPDLVNILLELNAKSPHYVSEADLKVFVLGPFLAGLDTAAATCAFMLYEALRNPRLLNRMTEEADLLFRDGTPAVDEVRSLDVIRRAMMESMRKYPMTVATMRRVANSFQFEGYSIPAGAEVLVAFTLSHLMEEYWSNPSEFDIDRFAEGRAEHTKEKGVYQPFGVGAHACLARGLAEVLVTFNVAAVLHDAELALDPPDYRLKVRQLPGLHPHSSLKFRIAGRRTP